MKQPQQNPDVTNYDTLNKFLMGTISMVRRKETSIEEAGAISQLADKIVKNNLTLIMDKKRRGDNSEIPFFEPTDKQVLIG